MPENQKETIAFGTERKKHVRLLFVHATTIRDGQGQMNNFNVSVECENN